MWRSYRLFRGLFLLGLLMVNLGAPMILISIHAESPPTQNDPLVPPTGITDRNTIFVDSQSPCPGNGTKAWPFCKIGYAVEKADPHDTIFVYSGIYYETSITIDKPLTLRGENRDKTIVDAQGEIWTFIFNTVADNVTITGFTIKNYGYQSAGIYCSGNNNNISNNVITTDYWEYGGNIIGLSLLYDHTIVMDNKISNNTIGIEVYGFSNTIQRNILVDNNGYGINVMSNNNYIADNDISNTVPTELHFNPASIMLFIASNNTIIGNTISDDAYNPNLIMFGIGGIFTEPCRDNCIENNKFSANNSDCVQIKSIHTPGVDNNTFVNNIFCSKYNHGVFLKNDILDTKFYKNKFQDCGISMSGNMVTFSSQEIPENNTVNNKPIYYYKNRNMDNASVPQNAGEVIIGNCSWVSLNNLQLDQGSTGVVCGYSSHIAITDTTIEQANQNGIAFFNTSDSVISRNTISNNGVAGIYIESVSFPPPPPPLSSGSANNIISENTIDGNYDGIHFSGASSHLMTGNIITNNRRVGLKLDEASVYNRILRNIISGNGIFLGYGIDISGSSNNIIQGNMITNNGYLYSGGILIQSTDAGIPYQNSIIENTFANSTYGIYIFDMWSLGPLDDTLIYHNNFLNNTYHAHDECINRWDNGYPSGGNFWDNYTGVDANQDGIGDTPYAIAGGDNQDRYPLMERFAPDLTPPTVSITKPKDGYLYLFDKEIMKRILSHIPLIIGRITIEVDASDPESGISRVEFYIDGVSTANDTSIPYSWTWPTKTFFTHTITVIAYNTDDMFETASVTVMKFF